MLTTVCVKFPDDDLAILEALEALEKLKRSDIVRRAIRAYAKQLGLLDAEGQPKKSRTKR
jgi:ribbon-helix-helix CopG family protein